MNPSDSNENLTMALRRMHRWRMAFFGLVLMISGSILGAAVTVLVVHPDDRRPGPPDPGKAAVMMTLRLKDELGLSDDQEEEIQTIFKTQMQKLEEIREAARPQIEAIMKATEDQVSKVLSEEQRKQLEEAMEGMRRQFQRGMGPGGPGGPRRGRDRRDQFGGPDDGPGRGGPGRDDWRGPGGRRGPRRGMDPNGGPPPMPPMEEGFPVEPNQPEPRAIQ